MTHAPQFKKQRIYDFELQENIGTFQVPVSAAAALHVLTTTGTE